LLEGFAQERSAELILKNYRTTAWLTSWLITLPTQSAASVVTEKTALFHLKS